MRKILFLLPLLSVLFVQNHYAQRIAQVYKCGASDSHGFRVEKDKNGKEVSVCYHLSEEEFQEMEKLRQNQRGEVTTVSQRGSASNIVVNYSGFTPEAQTAFQFAVDIWADIVTSTVPIVIDAQFTVLSAGVLGSARPFSRIGNFTNAPQNNILYPIALANSLAETDLNGSSPEILTNFNSNFDWNYSTTGNTNGKYDFVSVVLHEIGHGLGFSGSGNGTNLSNPLFVYDLFIQSGTTPITSLSGSALTTAFTSNNLFAEGPLTGRRKIFAPSTWNQGSSYSHWDENTFNNTSNALMTPQIGPGERIVDVGQITKDFFEDMGWRIGQKVASVNITTNINNNQNVVCGNNSVTFNAIPRNPGTAPTYSWRRIRNTVETEVATTSSFSTNNLADKDTFYVVLTSNEPTVLNPTANSVPISINKKDLTDASVRIQANITEVREGQTLIIQAIPTNGGVSPTFTWRLNGGNFGTSSSFSNNYSTLLLENTDVLVFQVTMTPSNDACSNQRTVTSEITINLVTSLEEETERFFSVSPNPSSDKFKVTLQRNIAQGNINVYDVQGRLVFQSNIQGNPNEFDIDLNNQKSGLYFLEITSPAGRWGKRIVKQ